MHRYRIDHQYKALKDLKDKLGDDEILFHVDFSENYGCKYNAEVQSMHFGGSREQVTLHTGMVYTKYYSQGFCTLSQCNAHNPSAIAAHLVEAMAYYIAENPNVKRFHFVSDGPTTQYRNRFMFYLITQYLTKIFPNIVSITYNFSEAGHGKGAPDPDGIGSFLKKLLDDLVRYGNDIPDYDTLIKILQERASSLFISTVNGDDIHEIGESIPLKVPVFKGAMKVHQYTWHRNKPKDLYFNTVSCFECKQGCKCTHYALGTLTYGKPSGQGIKRKQPPAVQNAQKKRKKS